MITCTHARQLFDRHLDDELSPSLQAELHAHLLQCSDCQNELAILEACGDVIRLDRREPTLDRGFADRVMASLPKAAPAPRIAAGAERAVPTSAPALRRWVYRLGAPVAAAASIALAVIMLVPAPAPDATPRTEGVTAAVTLAAPQEFRESLMDQTKTQLDPRAQAELERTPEIDALPFLESLLTPLVEGTRSTVEGTRRTASDIELLIRYGFADMNERLIAEYQATYNPASDRADQAGPQVLSDLDPLNPTFLSPEPVTADAPAPPEPVEVLPDAI